MAHMNLVSHRQHLLSVSDFALFSALAYESEAKEVGNPKL